MELDGTEMVRVEIHRPGLVEAIEVRRPMQVSLDLEFGQRELPPEAAGWRKWEFDGTCAMRLQASGSVTVRSNAPSDEDLSEIGTWLRQQFAEDERVARAAAELCGCHRRGYPNWEFDDDENEGRIVIRDDPHSYEYVGRPGLCRRWNRTYNDMFAARHVARWDPDRAIVEIAAKRELLVAAERHSPYVLRYLALPYRTRPGYRQEWRA